MEDEMLSARQGCDGFMGLLSMDTMKARWKVRGTAWENLPVLRVLIHSD